MCMIYAEQIALLPYIQHQLQATGNSWKLAVKCLIAVMLHGSYVLHKTSFTGENWIAFLQCYFVFVQEHGGQDLESFVLLNFNEACSLLVQVCRINSSLFFFKFEWVVSLFFLGLIVLFALQVTVALAVAEAAYEFEHRDLHWLVCMLYALYYCSICFILVNLELDFSTAWCRGNILLSRKDSATLLFTMEGKPIFIRTFGLVVSIIDFTLSRINTGQRLRAL